MHGRDEKYTQNFDWKYWVILKWILEKVGVSL